LDSPEARRTFEQTLERVRKWYGIYVAGYVVMPEHVHLLITEPESYKLSVAIQMLKQNVAQQLRQKPRPGLSTERRETRTGQPQRYTSL
jgi:putative transposase